MVISPLPGILRWFQITSSNSVSIIILRPTFRLHCQTPIVLSSLISSPMTSFLQNVFALCDFATFLTPGNWPTCIFNKYVNYDHPGECSPEKDCLW